MINLALLWLLCAWAAPRSGTNETAMNGQRDSVDYAAAGIALAALRVAIYESGSSQDSLVVWKNQRLNTAEAAQVLVSEPKPMRCELRKVAGESILTCSLIESAVLRESQVERARSLANEWATTVRSFASLSPSTEPSVLVATSDESRLVPMTALERFLRDYRIPCVLALFPPDSAARVAGAHARVEIRRAAGLEVVGFLPRK